MIGDITTFAEFMREVLKAAQQIGGMGTLGALATIITLLVSSLKIAPISRLIWSRLGWAQVLVAPALALAAGLVALAAAGTPITLPVLLAYLTAGGGAVFIHELLDAVKGMPGLGPVYVRLIDFAESLLTPSLEPTPLPPVVAAAASSSAPTSEQREAVKTARASLDDRFGRSRTL